MMTSSSSSSSSNNSSSSSSFLLVILHHLRLCYNYLLSFIFGHHRRGGHRRNNHDVGGGGTLTIVSLKNLFKRNRQQQLTFDNGTQIVIGNQIAEGGFSFVFEAFAVDNGGSATTSGATRESRTRNKRRYALKRINCPDHELVQSCRHEAGIHRSLPSDHPNLLELLGLKFDNTTTNAADDGGAIDNNLSRRREEYNVCYMLFPYLPYSLRGEITLRNILSMNQENHAPHQHYNSNSNNNNNTRRQPFTTYEVLHLFSGILDGLLAMHSANISHRDVKLENILLSPNSYGDHDHHQNHNHTHHGSSGQRRRMRSRYTPILMDFGSAGPLSSQPLTSRQSILQIIELASIHTTLSYRPPELTEGCCNLRHGSEEKLDYGKVDVWSLGCVLFGLLHGVSPFEMEFVRSGGSGGSGSDGQYGLVRVVDCTNLKILDEVPFPPWAGGGLGTATIRGNDSSNSSIGGEGGDGSNGKYPLSIYKFIRYMVQHDRLVRPNIQDVAKRFGELYYELLHEEWIPYSDKGGGSSSRMGVNDDNDEEREHDDFDSLIASRDFV